MKEIFKRDVTIIGAGLTGLTLAFYLQKAGRSVALIEKEERAGGVIRTLRKEGFVYETGPNTGVLSSGELVELFDDLRDECTMLIANSKGKNRWIWKAGRWHALPSGLLSAIRTPLFSLSDKFRILGEPFRKRGTNPYETLSEMVLRRMGRSYLDYAVDPFISGIYAGDPGRLVTRFALPKLYNLEQTYGSFIRGSMKKRRETTDALTKRATKEVFSVEGGLQRLTDALSLRVGSEHIFPGCSNTVVQDETGSFRVSFRQGERTVDIESPSVVTTVNSHHLPELLPFVPVDQMKPIRSLVYARVIQVVALFNQWDGIPLTAFGGLIPSREGRKVLGILFTSSIFAGRTPDGGAILSVFLGGMRHPEYMELSDETLREMALTEIRETLLCGVKGPDHLEICRYPYAIPQYERSSEERLEAISSIEKRWSGLILAGNIRDGIGISDRVKQARKIASLLTKE